MRSHMNGSVNHFESDGVSAGFAGRKNIVKQGNHVMSGDMPEFMIDFVNARTWNVVTWLKRLSQDVALLTERGIKNRDI